MKKYICLFLILASWFSPAYMQDQANYDESRVPSYTLPGLLITRDGKTIKTAKEWMEIRRPEILSLFEESMYGRIPGELKIASFKTIEQGNEAIGGKAVRKQVLLTFRKAGKELNVNLLIYLPKNVKKAPLFVGYNFDGNHTVTDDPAIILPSSWIKNDPGLGVSDNKATDQARGTGKGRWQAEKIIDAGYGLATLYYGDVDPDKNDFTDGVHPLLYRKNQTEPLPDEWGAISAWAWGLSRAMDYFEKDPVLMRSV